MWLAIPKLRKHSYCRHNSEPNLAFEDSLLERFESWNMRQGSDDILVHVATSAIGRGI